MTLHASGLTPEATALLAWLAYTVIVLVWGSGRPPRTPAESA
jgi:hypothetical protein